jgi:hypothetical protein
MERSILLFIFMLISISTTQSVSGHRKKGGINWNEDNWAFGFGFRGDNLSKAQARGVGASAAPGRTTRYWDCCKPSCGWRGKVSTKDTYVQSCQKDGNTVFNNPDATSGCDNGGIAFPCNSQIPWAINDQLAYGFAAASVPGTSEQDRCCACYKLDFTSGPVQGKSMIVQVVNSGADVGEGQFDLQIPGGGVGIFNGCTPQWNAPPDGWGQRYGGVGSRDECNQLPEQIRNGCFFRFDWFQGADNPTMTYSQVDCPSELTAKTGCSR